MRGGLRLVSLVTLSCLAAPLWAADVDPAAQNANRILAHRLVTDALDRVHSAGAAGNNAADEVALLLQAAERLDPENAHTLKMLVEAARLCKLPGKHELQRDTLRKLISVDPGDLVAQVAYLDFLASATQAIDERAGVYRKALDSVALDPQIRSEMALRLARIASERGDANSAREFLQQALTLNDVNMGALREMAALSTDTPAHHLAALIALLNANPLQPEAWVTAAGVLSAGGAHDRAADDLVIALEQMQIAGQQAPGEVYLTLGMELATGTRQAQAFPFLNGMARLPDAPLSALVAARVLSYEYTPPAPATNPAATTQPQPPLSTDDLTGLIRNELKKSAATDPPSTDALAQAAWIELSANSEPSPDTANWIQKYATLVPADDPVLARLNAWQLLRQHHLPEAQAALEKLAPDDALAKLGLARAQLEQNQHGQAVQTLQELWSAQPTGLLAMQIAQTARAAHIGLAETPLTRQLIGELSKLQAGATTAHRTPRDTQLVSASLTQRVYAITDPVLVNLHITNTSGHAAPVGADGLIKTAVSLTALKLGLQAQNLGMFAVEDLQRVYRLDRSDAINATVRVDQGPMADRFQANPVGTESFTLQLMTVPRISGKEVTLGLGGQQITIGDFDHAGAFDRVALPTIAQLVKDLPTMPIDKQMGMSNVLIALLKAVQDAPNSGAPDAAAAEAIKSLRTSMLGVLKDLVNSPSPAMRAWMTRLMPRGGAGDEMQAAIDRKGADPDPLVRMMWGTRQSIYAEDPELNKQAVADLEKQADVETDPLAREWFKSLLGDVKERINHSPSP